MYTVKGRFVREEVCILIYKVVIHFIVGYNIHRVLQIDLMEKRVWYLPFFVLMPRFISSASVYVSESDS